MGEAAGKITLKLLVDKNEKRVIFGEAGKEFVDIVFNFLSLPVGTVVKLVSKDKMVGSLGKIYESIEAMHANYMQPNVNKQHVLLNPKVSSSTSLTINTPSLLGYELNDSEVLYRYMSRDPQAVCPECRTYMNSALTCVHGPGEKEAAEVKEGSGYVKGLVTCMVMDDLQVKPMSTISSITLLSTCMVQALEKRRLWRC